MGAHPRAAMHGIEFIQDLAVILVVAGVVGWIFQRIGLSAIVGYLVAGMLVGPYTPHITLVTDVPRVQTLAQIGIVFLMFSIGLRLSLRKLRRLGLSLIVATAIGAMLVYYLTRTLGIAIGWTGRETLFLAGMLMVSSSAIVSRILHESGTTHEHPGQLVMGISVLEDVVAVVMLTLLNSLVHMGQGARTEVGQTLLMLGAFVVLSGVAGLLLVPWLLKRMSIAANEELQTLGIGALLFGLAVVADAAGYSLALGAFLLGTIVAETLHRHQVERTFEGMRDIFSAVFFVAIGMQINARDLWREIGLIAGISAFTLVVRPMAVTTGLTLIGTPIQAALRTGLMAVPIGEFSFIIAQLGISAAVVPPRFYPLAVGVSVLTTLAAPLLTRRSEAASQWLLTRQPRWLDDWVRAYQGWLARLGERRARNLLWQLSRKRVAQVAVGVLFVTGLVVFSSQLFSLVHDWLGPNWLLPHAPEVGFWTVLVLLILAPIVAIWRNLSAMALLYAEVATRGHAHAKRLRPVIETTLKAAAGALMYMWLASILPAEGTAKWLLVVTSVIALVALIVLRRKLIYWHSEMEVEILGAMETANGRMTATTAPWLQPHSDWNLHMVDCTLPDLAEAQGKAIADLDLRASFGCSVVGIERQGYMIPLPPPETILYPRDKVLLMGTAEQINAGRQFLSRVSAKAPESVYEEIRMEAIIVPDWSRVAGRTLGELSVAREYGVQVAGVHRGGLRILNPGGEERIRAGDEILILGTPIQIDEFKEWMRIRVNEVTDAKSE